MVRDQNLLDYSEDYPAISSINKLNKRKAAKNVNFRFFKAFH